MWKWEYLVIVISGNVRFDPKIYTVNNEEMKKEISFHGYLRELGEQGWELVATKAEVY